MSNNNQRIVNDYPDLDCVMLNSGFQTQIRLSRPAEVDLDAFHDEMNTNYSRLVDLSIKFLPHLQKKPFPTALTFTTSLLAFVPAVTCPSYSASKAALNTYILCLRRQNQGSNTKIIEISPPAVQSEPLSFSLPCCCLVADPVALAELHDYMGVETGRALGMPLDEFTEQAWEQLAAGSDHVIVSTIGPAEPFLEQVKARRDRFEGLSNLMLGHFEL